MKTREVTLFDRQNEIVSTIRHEGDMVSMTDLWREAGSPQGKTPNDWIRQDSSKQLIETVGNMLVTVSNRNVDNQIVRTKRGGSGGGGGTYGHKQVALAYAKYLDPKLHVLVNEVFFQRLEEEKNPDLIIDRAIATYKRKGKTDKWIGQRLKSKGTRNEFTSCLAAHGVERDGFKNCTNAIYRPLYGGTTAVVRAKKHLDDKENIRDNMNLEELCAVEFAEMLSRNKINANNLNGNAQCELACTHSSNQVANLIIQSRKTNKMAIL